MKRATLVLAALALVLGGVGQARADFITYKLTTTASGTINGTTETNAPLTVTVTYDTSKVRDGVALGLFIVDNQSVGVTFGGITDTVTTASQTQLDVTAGGIGVVLPGLALPLSSALLAMHSDDFQNTSLTALPSGPFSGISLLSGTTYNTTNGSISVTSAGTVTFTSSPAVSGVPEPASLTLLGIGALCSLGYGWRRRTQAA
jgi:hypothetical protein